MIARIITATTSRPRHRLSIGGLSGIDSTLQDYRSLENWRHSFRPL